MSGKNIFTAALLGMALLGTTAFSGERTIPVDIFLMVDKSLSMAEDGKFDGLHSWVTEHLVAQMLIPGDRISVWEFYGRAERVLDTVIPESGDTSPVVKAIDGIVPDGEYTDIGLALDTIREAIAGWGDPERLKILYMLTDLKQEAPWSSRYAGVEERYDSPYLAEARILTHGNWYEITLDMNIQDQVVEETKKLYSSILRASSEPRDESFDGASGSADFAGSHTPGEDGGNTAQATLGEEARNAGQSPGSAGKDSVKDGSRADQGPLPLIAGLVILCVAAAGLGIVIARAHSRKKRKEESKPSLDA